MFNSYEYKIHFKGVLIFSLRRYEILKLQYVLINTLVAQVYVLLI